MHNDLFYQVALTLVPQIGPVQARILMEHFEDAADVFKASEKKLGSIEHIGEVRANAIRKFNDFETAEQELTFIEKYKISPLFIRSKDYPQRLKRCYDAPLLLYYRGTSDLNKTKIISIIGTRSNTEYGKSFTEKLINDLAEQQCLIVSGLAFGIDAIAHKAALQNELPTIGVLAHGLDSIYPAQHKPLAKEILQNGGLLTEFTQKTKPDKHNFPKRNRIVAGIADATIVIETAIKGGSMITAELAADYKRDVFAVPGRITDSKSAGCNYLVKTSKAVLLTDARQLTETLHWTHQQKKIKQQKELFAKLNAHETIVVQLLAGKDSTHIDEIFLKSGLTSSSIAAAILSLELQGIVTSLPGKLYKLY